MKLKNHIQWMAELSPTNRNRALEMEKPLVTAVAFWNSYEQSTKESL